MLVEDITLDPLLANVKLIIDVCSPINGVCTLINGVYKVKEHPIKILVAKFLQ
jgi:hypothetical protein